MRARIVEQVDANWRRLTVAALIVVFNVVSLDFLGVSQGRFEWQAFAQMYLPGENDFPDGCTDGVDNDGDMLIDCEDPDCFAFVGCVSSPAPVLSGYATLVTIVILSGFAFYAIRRRRQDSASD